MPRGGSVLLTTGGYTSSIPEWILYADGSSVYHQAVTQRIIASLVGPESDGTRLVDQLCRRFTYCDQAQWQSFMESGCLLVEGIPGRADQLLVKGQRIEFLPPKDIEPPVDTAYSVVYENSRLLVVYKPPLLPIHPGGPFFAHTLWHLLNHDFGKVHIATRLDRETSGLVLIARDVATARYLQEQQSLGAIHKTYLALVHGRFPAGRQDASGWLVPDRGSSVRKKRRFVSSTDDTATAVEPGADSCSTMLTGMDCWEAEDGPRSLIEAQLRTGRTHQIRATLFSLGYPVLGDKLYGLDEGFFLRFIEAVLSAGDVSRLILPYQALHCASLEFKDPDGRSLGFPVPAPWAGLVDP